MNIFDHIIPDGSILGIGPLLWQPHPDWVYAEAYRAGRYIFDLHTLQQSITIRSDYFYDPTSDGDKDAKGSFRHQYVIIRNKIAALTGEDHRLLTDIKTEADNVVSDLKFEINCLLQDLQLPGNFAQVPVNERIQNVFSHIDQLKKFLP